MLQILYPRFSLKVLHCLLALNYIHIFQEKNKYIVIVHYVMIVIVQQEIYSRKYTRRHCLVDEISIDKGNEYL